MSALIVPTQLTCNSLKLPDPKRLTPGLYYAFVFAPNAASWSLSPESSFVTHFEKGPSEPGYALWQFEVVSNPGSQKQGFLVVKGPGHGTKIPVVQAAADSVGLQVALVISPPPGTERASFPLAMELGAAGKFLAQNLKKLPPPARAAAFVALEGVILGLGVSVTLIRAAFASVPEPRDYYGSDLAPITARLIRDQTGRLVQYITEEMLSG